MVSFTSALVLFITLATTAIHVAANPDGLLHELVVRQTFDPNSFPQQCQDECSSLLSSLSAQSCSTNLQCVCGNDIATKTRQCAQCDASIVGQNAAQSLYQKYADDCKSAGITVPSFTASGSGSGSNSGGNSGNTGSGAYSNLQMSAAGVLVGSAALAFLLAT